MTGLELGRVVVDEGIFPPGQHARVRSQPTALEVGLWGVDRIVYVPGLALVVVLYQDTTSALVPIEHVWQMSPRAGALVLETLAEGMR